MLTGLAESGDGHQGDLQALQLTLYFNSFTWFYSARVGSDAVLFWSGSFNFVGDRLMIVIRHTQCTLHQLSQRACTDRRREQETMQGPESVLAQVDVACVCRVWSSSPLELKLTMESQLVRR